MPAWKRCTCSHADQDLANLHTKLLAFFHVALHRTACLVRVQPGHQPLVDRLALEAHKWYWLPLPPPLLQQWSPVEETRLQQSKRERQGGEDTPQHACSMPRYTPCNIRVTSYTASMACNKAYYTPCTWLNDCYTAVT